MKHVIGVTTTKPSSTLTPGGGGGCLTLIDPRTGAILSSMRSSADLSGRTSLGISSMSKFPSSFSISNNLQPVLAYGGNSIKKGDTYAMLVSIRSASLPPILHWKCRLPEPDMTGGLVVSPCGYYTVGGGASGSCYVWASLGGQLLRTVKAHYRPCTCLEWSDCGRYLVTGGADGMIHSYSLMDLVDISTRNSKRAIAPLHTFSVHHFPITSLVQLPSGRMASAADDGRVVVLELFSKLVLMNIQFPHGIRCISYYDGRLYLGSMRGTIYSVDMNAYAMHQTEKQGAIFAKQRHQEQLDGTSRTIEDTIFGKNKIKEENVNSSSPNSYQTDWVGHDYPVTSIALLTQEKLKLMISGDELGQLRIWDLDSRTCLNAIQPWSHSMTGQTKKTVNATTSSTPSTHPITSMRIIAQPSEQVSSSIFRTNTTPNSKKLASITSLVTPLQKYSMSDEEMSNNNQRSTTSQLTRIPFLKRDCTAEILQYWEAKPIYRKRKRQSTFQVTSEASNVEVDKKDHTTEFKIVESNHNQQNEEQVVELQNEILELRKQLQIKQNDIDRWEKVNNKLMTKLQHQQQQSKS